MIYKLKKGKHRSRPLRPILWFGSKQINLKIKFSEECWYKRISLEHSGINKLFGLAYCLHGEQTFGQTFLRKYVNSILIGWRANVSEGKISLYAYRDERGVETREPLAEIVNVGEYFSATFVIQKNVVKLLINGNIVYQGEKPRILFGYYLKPYFGGKSTAPYDMEIEILKYE